MMIVNAVFHISKFEKSNGYKLLDGRVLQDINLADKLILLKNINIHYYNNYCDNLLGLKINDDEPYVEIQINKIYSYGAYWESLPAGMSARLECYCEIDYLTDLILCKIM